MVVRRKVRGKRESVPNIMVGWAYLGIGIEETNADIGSPASRILVWYRTRKMPDCVNLVRYRTCSSIVSFFQSGTGLTGCRTVRHSGISIYTYTDIDMDMKHWHKLRHWHEHVTWTWHAVWTWTCSMDMGMQHGHGHAAWTWTRTRIWSCGMDLDSRHAWMHGCRYAGMPIKSSVRHC